MSRSKARWQRAKADTKSLRSWKADLARVILAGGLTAIVVWATNLPDASPAVELIPAAILAGSILAVGLVEFAWNWLRAAYRWELGNERQLRKQQRELYEEIEARNERKIQHLEAENKVLWGVYHESQKGITVPLSALLARLKLETQVGTGEFQDKRKAA